MAALLFSQQITKFICDLLFHYIAVRTRVRASVTVAGGESLSGLAPSAAAPPAAQ